MKARKQKKHRLKEFYVSLVLQIKRDKKAFVVYCIIQTVVLCVFVRSVALKQWESSMTCVLACILLLLPPFVEKNAKIDLPTTLESCAYIFVFCAEILGEIGCFYVKVKNWDTMLHTINGFMFAAFGFCLVDIFNKNGRFRFQLSAGFLAVVAFCFSMTIGVLWEFVEYAADHVAKLDMQKDTVVTEFSSVTLDETNSNIPIKINNIEQTTIRYGDDEYVVIDGGYLDIGLNDTMKDLFVNFVGAVFFSGIGYIYVKQRGKGKIAASLIPRVEEDEDEYNGPEDI